jgi:transposase
MSEQAVNRWYYLKALKCLRENARRKILQLWRNSCFLYHDNMPAHASLLICDFLANINIAVLPQPPYSSDLAPLDFFLFPTLKYTLKRQQFQMIKEITKNSQTKLCAIMKKAYQDSFPEVATALGVVHQCRRGAL